MIKKATEQCKKCQHYKKGIEDPDEGWCLALTITNDGIIKITKEKLICEKTYANI